MNFLNKILFALMVIFLGNVLWITLCYSEEEYACCHRNKHLYGCGEILSIEQLSLISKNNPQGNNCYYIPSRNSSINKNLSSRIDLEDDKFHSINQNISKTKILSFKETIVIYQDNRFTIKFPSLFLLNSSFTL